MSRRPHEVVRCGRCRMHIGLCVCSLVPSPPLVARTKIVLLIHRAEDRKSTNTGRLAAACIAGSRVVVRGERDRPLVPFEFGAEESPVLLFPHEDARALSPFEPRPTTLVVPDGNWRQASRMRQRVPGMRDLPCVALPADGRARLRLRAESREEGLSTIEAIARALGILEGPTVQVALETVFRAVVERTLWQRGLLARDDVDAGVPAGIRPDNSGRP